MNPFKRQIYKFGLIEDDDKNPPTVDDNSEEYTSGVFPFNTSHFTNNFQDKDLDSYKLTRIRSLPSVGQLNYAGNPVEVGFVFDLANVSNLTYELPDNYMISSQGYCKFEKPISTIISEQETEGFDLTYLGTGRLEFEKIVTSTLPNDTDIYAFFDATSMKIVDAQAAQAALLEWYDLFQQNNDLFTGNLYILPIVKENWLDFPNIIWRGSSNRVRNNSDRPNDDFMALAQLPPNFDVTSNDTNSSWTPPTKIVTLAFIDEVESGSEAYHKNRNGYGFDGQPMTQYLTDYKNFKENYENNFDFFKGVLYPIPDIEYGNYNNIGNAMVLQGFAAIEGEATYTLKQIEDLGVTYAKERRFDWHLDPNHSYYTGTNLTVANPYSAAAKTPVPNTNYFLQGLKTMGWAGVYDKDQPASSVFTSDTFNSDLNKYLEGSVTTTRETRVIEGECFASGDICFDFQTSDDSSYKLFSNIATFCFTGTDNPDNVQTATPPTVDSMVRDYNRGLYQVVLGDFTNNFQDADGDSYLDTTLLGNFTSGKGVVVDGLTYNGGAITFPYNFPLANVSNLEFQISPLYYVDKDRLYKFTEELTISIVELENQGYSLFDNQGGTLTYKRLNTSDPQNPTVETQTIKGNDIGGGSISIPFKTSDDSSFKLYSNTATLSLKMENDNTAPTVAGWSGVVSVNEFTFTSAMFSTNFVDAEGDSLNSVKIETNIVSSKGMLTYQGYPIAAPFAFDIANVGDLRFEIPERFVFQGADVYSFDKSVAEYEAEYSALGYTLDNNAGGVLTFSKTVGTDTEYKYVVGYSVTTKEYCFTFRVSDDNEFPLFSNIASVCLTIPDVETPIDFNQPPTVGDNEFTI